MSGKLVPICVALVVLVVELGATLGSASGEPFSPVPGWAPTRPLDGFAFTLVILGCGVLALLGRFPRTAAGLATGAYCAFALGDYELGMFLAPMVAVFVLAARGRSLLAAGVCALSSLGAGLIWVATRAVTITDPGITMLVWVAFGATLAAFFTLPLLLGQVLGLRRRLRWGANPAAGHESREGTSLAAGHEPREGARDSVPPG